MITVRRAAERGRTRFDWLDSRHTFSFGEYHDPRQMGFSELRVINDDVVEPGQGFGSHSHRDMEILTFVLEGALEHKDSTGTSSVIRPGDVQRMSAGTGITHSEFNPSRLEPVHFLQIWILPQARGLRPGYEQTSIPEERRRGRLALLASPDGDGGSIRLHQNARVYGTVLAPDQDVVHSITPGRNVWIHVARGAATIDGHALQAGDGAAVVDETSVSIAGGRPGGAARPDDESPDAEVLLFDLP